MAQQITDSFLLTAAKNLDDKTGVLKSGIWSPYDNVAEFYARFPNVNSRAEGQFFWVRNSTDSNKADLYTISKDKTAYKVRADVDLSAYSTTVQVEGLIDDAVTPVEEQLDELNDDLIQEIQDRQLGDQTNADAIVAETERAIAVENTKFNSADAVVPFTITYAELVSNVYTNILFANKTASITYYDPTDVNYPNSLKRTPITFNSSGAVTMPITAPPGFVGYVDGLTGIISDFATQEAVDALNLAVFGITEQIGAQGTLSTYTSSQVDTAHTFGNVAPFLTPGIIKKVVFNCTKIGPIPFFVNDKTANANEYTQSGAFGYEATSLGVKTLVAGIDFPDGIRVKEEGGLFWYNSASTGKIGYKLDAPKSFYRKLGYMTSPSTFSVISGLEFGIYVEVFVEDLRTEVSEIATAIQKKQLYDTLNGYVNLKAESATTASDFPAGGINGSTGIVASGGSRFKWTGYEEIPDGVEKIYYSGFAYTTLGWFYDEDNDPLFPSHLITVGSGSFDRPVGAVYFACTVSDANNPIAVDYAALFYGYQNDYGFLPLWAGLNITPPFDKKSIVCFGDSVTEFGNYPQEIATILGGTVYKIGFGGCLMSTNVDADYNQLSMINVAATVASQNFTAMQTAVNNLVARGDDNRTAFNLLKTINFANVDFVTIFYGTNDFTASIPLGSNTDTTGATFKGSINATVNSLLTAYPKLKIIFITPTHRYFGSPATNDSDTVANSLGLFLVQYCDSIIQASNINHLPTLDMYREGGFNKYNHTTYFVDGVHPNTLGYSWIAQKISAFLTTQFKF